MSDFIQVRPAIPADRGEWLRMRCIFWPEVLSATHAKEISEYLASSGWDALRAFVAERPSGRQGTSGLCGFLEASIRPYAEDCTTRPVGYLEGWYVDADVRRRGIARALVQAAESWARKQGCREMASDTLLANELGQRAHLALGYEETSRVVHLRKWL